MHNINKLIDYYISKNKETYYNLTPDELIEIAVEKGEGYIAKNGALSINTGKYTGRSPKDRFIVDESVVHDSINWNDINRPISSENFKELFKKAMDYIDDRDI